MVNKKNIHLNKYCLIGVIWQEINLEDINRKQSKKQYKKGKCIKIYTADFQNSGRQYLQIIPSDAANSRKEAASSFGIWRDVAIWRGGMVPSRRLRKA
jgi:hypothetical protein